MFGRHFFAGVNSPLGFYSNFEHIAPDKDCRRKIYIKGGPGMGKSTLMKKIVRSAHGEGYAVDVFHCSSDASSLDGVYIPKLKTAVLDATAPHNSDPVYPGVTGEIFNAADCLCADALAENAEEILHFTEHKARAFAKAYNYLRAAKPIIAEVGQRYKNSMYLHGIDIEADKALRNYVPDIPMPKEGKIRKLFASAITPDGFESYFDTVFRGKHVVAFKGGYGTDILIKKIMDTAAQRGFSLEAFYCPMFPDTRVEHIVIRDIKTVFTTYNHYHHYSAADTVDLDEYVRELPLDTDRAWNTADSLLKQAVTALSEARAAHSFLESFYTPAMDFDALSEKADDLISSIFE